MELNWKTIAVTAIVLLAADLLAKAVEPRITAQFPNIFQAPGGPNGSAY